MSVLDKYIFLLMYLSISNSIMKRIGLLAIKNRTISLTVFFYSTIACIPNFTLMTKDDQNKEEGEGKGTMTVSEAGHKGGEKVKEEYGPEFYSDIGEKGGEAVVEKYGPEHMAEIG